MEIEGDNMNEKKYPEMTNLTIARIKKGLSQKELAKLVGLNNKQICCYEKGYRFPKRSILEKLATALECRVQDII